MTNRQFEAQKDAWNEYVYVFIVCSLTSLIKITEQPVTIDVTELLLLLRTVITLAILHYEIQLKSLKSSII